MYSSDEGSVKQAAFARVATRRERHQRRSWVVRALTFVAGMLLSLAGLLLLWAPELGLPLILAGLGLLALEFDWATRAQAWTEWRAVQLRHWFSRQSMVVKAGVPLFLIAATIAAVILWVLH